MRTTWAAGAADHAVRPRGASPLRGGLFAQAVGRFGGHPTGRLGLAIVGAYVLVTVAAPWIVPIDPLVMARGQELAVPSRAHLLGTDEFGRDILSRTVYGVRVSLLVGTLAVLLGGVPGVLSGLVSGYIGGRFDATLMRLWDGLLAFPTILLAIALATVLGAGPLNAGIALGMVGLPQFSRIARASVLVEREQEYVLAARASGALGARIMGRHILPNVLAPVLVQVTLAMGYAVLLEAGLSFLGLGVQPPDPSLGGMLNSSRKYLYQASWYAVFPGATITGLLLGLNWVSEALAEILDPRATGRAAA
ncbi:MAG: ABC transporter permease [Candidatus Rokuibacteriota bacterium]